MTTETPIFRVEAFTNRRRGGVRLTLGFVAPDGQSVRTFHGSWVQDRGSGLADAANEAERVITVFAFGVRTLGGQVVREGAAANCDRLLAALANA